VKILRGLFCFEFKNTEGAVTKNTSGVFEYEYALRDHLGNTRATFADTNNDGIVTNTDIRQINHYYPFGLNMEGNWTPSGANGEGNKYQYNGKELNEDFGLNWNDYGARFYDAAIGRFPSIDLLADIYANQTPYAYAANNPATMIDYMGMGPEDSNREDKKIEDNENSFRSTHTNEQGEVIAVYNDGDLGVYVHSDAKTKEDVTKKRAKTGTTSGGGKFIGFTAYWDEFINPDTKIEEGKILYSEDDDAHSWDFIIDWMHNDAMRHDLKEVGDLSKLNAKYDLKSNKEWAGPGRMTGRKLNGKWASARSAGNHLAGRNGRYGYFFGYSISLDTYMKLAGALQQGHYGKWNAFRIVTFGISYGNAPYYGEIDYTGRRVVEGWNSSQKKKPKP
jgi:RHS repeat-associated protein